MKQPKISWLAHRAAVIAAVGASLAAAGHAFAADEKSTDSQPVAGPSDHSSDYNNWVELSVANAWVRNNDASFQQQHGVRADQPFGGISDLHIEQELGKTGLFTVDGHAIYDNRDYLIKLGLSQSDLGYIQAGYKQYRTYYDGSGGFYPTTGLWYDLYNDEMGLDRGEAWGEAGLTLPDMPVFKVRYTHQFRKGMKDSTEWGDTAAGRSIVPTFYDIDEKRDVVELDVTHNLGSTEASLGFRYDRLDQDNQRVVRRQPGAATDRTIVSDEIVKSDLFNGHGYVQTRINEKVMVTLGGSYTTLDTDTGGSRIYYLPSSGNDHGFTDLTGGSGVKQWVGNLSVMLQPSPHLTIVPSLRVENQCQEGIADFTETSTNVIAVIQNTRTRDFLDVTESLEARYTGIKNWVLSGKATLTQGQGNLRENEIEPEETPVLVSIYRDTDSCRFVQKYQLGANWYPNRHLNFAVQAYYKRRANEYTHNADDTTNNTANRYPAYLANQNFDTEDVNARVTWHPSANLTLVTRYDFQFNTIDTRADLLAQVQSAKGISHIISQNISWVPWSRLYLQGAGSYAYDEFTTPADDITGTAAGRVTKTQNGYWQGSLLAGFVVSDNTDLQAQYAYYRADDYYNNSATGLPYGADDEQHTATVGIIHRINKNLRLSLKYGYFVYHDRLSGGHNNYEAHMIGSNLQYRF